MSMQVCGLGGMGGWKLLLNILHVVVIFFEGVWVGLGCVLRACVCVCVCVWGGGGGVITSERWPQTAVGFCFENTKFHINKSNKTLCSVNLNIGNRYRPQSLWWLTRFGTEYFLFILYDNKFYMQKYQIIESSSHNLTPTSSWVSGQLASHPWPLLKWTPSYEKSQDTLFLSGFKDCTCAEKASWPEPSHHLSRAEELLYFNRFETRSSFDLSSSTGTGFISMLHNMFCELFNMPPV